MTKIAQDVILKQIKVLKDQIGSLERVVEDYFLWLDTRSPTLRAAESGDGAVKICERCGLEYCGDIAFHNALVHAPS